jgi:N-acetylmuramoyl-L-alanine amidase
MRTLRKGDRGEDVKTLQKALGISADGIFGSGTEKAVIVYQKSKGLVADGVVGAKTWAALGITDSVPSGVQTVRKITHIFVHCTAGSQSETPESLLNFFYKKKRWSRPGYHYVVSADGTITNIWPESKYSNGVKNMNSHSINIAWIGGVDKAHPMGIDNRTDAQKRSLRLLLKELRAKYPKAVIMGHRDTSPDLNHNGIVDPWERIKECPCFSAMEEYKDI